MHKIFAQRAFSSANKFCFDSFCCCFVTKSTNKLSRSDFLWPATPVIIYFVARSQTPFCLSLIYRHVSWSIRMRSGHMLSVYCWSESAFVLLHKRLTRPSTIAKLLMRSYCAIFKASTRCHGTEFRYDASRRAFLPFSCFKDINLQSPFQHKQSRKRKINNRGMSAWMNHRRRQQQKIILNFRSFHEWKFCEEFQASAASTLPKTLIISLASFRLLMLIHPSAHANRKTIEPWKKRKAWMEEKYRSLAFATEVFPVVTWIRPLKEETMNENHGESYVSLTFAWATVCTFTAQHLHNRFSFVFLRRHSRNAIHRLLIRRAFPGPRQRGCKQKENIVNH